jgi:hypothetical protein
MKFKSAVEERSYMITNYRSGSLSRISPDLLVFDNYGCDIGYLASSSLALVNNQKYTGKHYLMEATRLPSGLAYDKVYLATSDGVIQVINGKTFQRSTTLDGMRVV